MKESKKIPQTNAEVQRLLTLLDMQNRRVEELEDLLNQKDGELSQKEKELNQKYIELNQKDIELNQQREELSQKDLELNQQREKLIQKEAELSRKIEELLQTTEALNLTKEEYEHLNSQFLRLQRQVYGYRSEKKLPDPKTNMMGWLFSSDWEVECLEAEKGAAPIQEELAGKAKELKANKASEKRERKPRELKVDPSTPVTMINHEPEGIDPEKHIKIGERRKDLLQLKPCQFYIERHIYPVYKDRNDTYLDNATILRAPIDVENASGVKLGNTIYATFMVDKFRHHLPESRQIKRYKELGVELSKSTISRGIADISFQLAPLYDALVQKVLKSSYLQMDESTMRIRDNKGKTRKGYVWAARSMDYPGVFFYYDNGSRSATTLLSILKDYQGALQSDGYAAYSQYEQKEGVTPLACMAHVRRKFEQASKEGDKRADDMLKQIGLLYTLEAQLKEEKAPPDKIHSERMRLAAPLLVAMEAWMKKVFLECTPKSTLGKAITYAHTVWIRIARYCTDGRYEIDNNGMERVMRYIAMGRNNYLFVNNNASAENYTRIYSFMATCDEAGVNFYDWLLAVLPKLPKIGELTEDEIINLLPGHIEV